MAQLPVLATPQEAKKVWDRQQRPSARGVARALTQAGRPVISLPLTAGADRAGPWDPPTIRLLKLVPLSTALSPF